MSGPAIAWLTGFAIGVAALLRGWRDWIELKRLELGQFRSPRHTGGAIELADLKERIRKLEAIAAGID